MKKIFIVLTLFLIILLLVFKSEANIKIMWNEFKSIFHETEYFKYETKGDVQKVLIRGSLVELNEGSVCIDDNNKILNFLEILDVLSVCTAKKEELESNSPDIIIYLIDGKEELVGNIWIYGTAFIEDHMSGNFYRLRNDNIIKKINNILLHD